MENKEPGNHRRQSRAARLFHTLVEARWFFSFSSSVMATVVGISLTFGINSCRENRRMREELRKSMQQAADTLGERFIDAHEWVEAIEAQNRIFQLADSLYTGGAELPDSICEEFRYTLPFIKISAFDHEFEKIFRGSYQLWQLQNSKDSLAFYIGLCYDGLNMVENTCQDLTEGMLRQIGEVNETEHFYRLPPREWTETLLSDPRFQYYMSVRRVKSEVASHVLQLAQRDYEENVLPRTDR